MILASDLDLQGQANGGVRGGARVREFLGFERQGWKRLEILDAATSLTDLRALPSNRLEGLKGDRSGQFSIHINDPWRLCFEWPQGASGPPDVEIVDHHGAGTIMIRPAIHPGAILADELQEIGLNASESARHIHVPVSRLTRILQGKQSITGDTALRLGRWFGNSAQFWLNRQSAFELRQAEVVAGAELPSCPCDQRQRRRSGPS